MCGYWATTLAYGVAAPFFIAAGGIMALAMYAKFGCYESDPATMPAALAGPGFTLLSLLMAAFANIGTQGTGSYINCMIVKSGLPNIKYKTLVLIAMVYVSALTVWGWVIDNFGAFISCAAYLQGPIIGMTLVDCLILKKRRISFKSLYYLDGHHAYDFTKGFNLVGVGCLLIAFVSAVLFVYDPVTCTVKSGIFLVTTGSGFTAIFGGLLYWLASLTPLRAYMLRDREDLDVPA